MHSTDKASLRSEVLAARRARSADALEAARAAIRTHVLDRAARDGWRVIAAYEPFATEPGSVELLAECEQRGLTVIVPVRLPDNDLDWVRWSASHDAPESLGNAAIATADVVLTPALAVSLTGARLGRGGGSYDRALARVPAEVVIAAVVFDDEIRSDVPSDEWDVPVSAVVTPSGWSDL